MNLMVAGLGSEQAPRSSFAPWPQRKLAGAGMHISGGDAGTDKELLESRSHAQHNALPHLSIPKHLTFSKPQLSAKHSLTFPFHFPDS